METPKNLIPLIDADLIVYRCGFAGDEEEPLEFKLQSVKTVLDGIMGMFPEAPSRRIFLSGKNNYRDKLATIRIYKGNRDPHNKPVYYDEIRQYLIDFQGAEVIDGMEADDKLGIEQWKCKDRSTCIVTSDKDLNCIPGWHYNWVKGETYYQTLADANKCFWTQVLTGDTTDNIQGIPKVGPKTAEKVLAKTNGSWIEMYTAVAEEYKKYYKEQARAAFHENASLVWIQREAGVNYDNSRFSICGDT